jgi:hypothetical protein
VSSKNQSRGGLWMPSKSWSKGGEQRKRNSRKCGVLGCREKASWAAWARRHGEGDVGRPTDASNAGERAACRIA